MIMVIGGAFQGKETFVKEHLSFEGEMVDGKNCRFDDIFTCGAIVNFHLFIQRFMEEERLDQLPEALMQKNEKLILISDEIGYGIVPLEQKDRFWREKTGRLCCRLAGLSCEVYRIVAGIPSKIKG